MLDQNNFLLKFHKDLKKPTNHLKLTQIKMGDLYFQQFSNLSSQIE